MKKTVKTVLASILSLSAILTASACGAQTAQESSSAEASFVLDFPEDNAEAPDLTVKSHKEALAVARDFTDWMENYAKDNDYESFRSLFDDSNKENNVHTVFDYYRDALNDGSYYDSDVTVLCFDEDEILMTSIRYCNYIDDNGKDAYKSVTPGILPLKLTNGRWLSGTSISDKLNGIFKERKIDNYGRDAAEKGYCSPDYQILTDKALLSSVNAIVKSVVLNGDGSLTITLAIENGFNYDVMLNKLTGTISFGNSAYDASATVDLFAL